MSVKYNGTTLSNITFTNTNLTVLKYNNTPIWGKPYTLTITSDTNSNISVTRTSSPNEHAASGILTNGSTIYHGDTLTITFTANDGYKLETSLVNNTTFTSGNSITVENNINIVTTSVASKSWHTVWSGNQAITNFNGANNFPGVIANAEKTRITGAAYMSFYVEDQETWDSTASQKTHQIVEKELGYYIAANYEGDVFTGEKQASSYIPTGYPIYIAFQSAGSNTINCSGISLYAGFPLSDIIFYDVHFMNQGVKITKIEQYY